MKKFSVKSYAAGLLTMVFLFSPILALAETQQAIDVIFGRIKLVVDGKPVDKETLLYNGTTYVPLRAAAEILGKEVEYDEDSKTAYINDRYKSFDEVIDSLKNGLTPSGMSFTYKYASFDITKDEKDDLIVAKCYDSGSIEYTIYCETTNGVIKVTLPDMSPWYVTLYDSGIGTRYMGGLMGGAIEEHYYMFDSVSYSYNEIASYAQSGYGAMENTSCYINGEEVTEERFYEYIKELNLDNNIRDVLEWTEK